MLRPSVKILSPLKSFLELLRSAELSKGISFAVAAILPLVISGYFDELQIGISMAIGVLLASPSNVPGSLRRRMIGVSFSIAIAVFATILAGAAARYDVLFVPILAVLMFGFSMISVYGFRASLISFSGLFAVVLSMAKVASEGGILTHAFLLGLGGLWYLLFSVVLHFINARKEVESLLAEAIELTSDYLKVRAALLQSNKKERKKNEQKLIDLQTDLNEKHELIRDMLISRRKNSGRSAMMRKKLLIFMEIVDILELSMANPVNYNRMDMLFAQPNPELDEIKSWSLLLARELGSVGEAIRSNKSYRCNKDLHKVRNEVLERYTTLKTKARTPEDRDAVLVYRNLIDFKEKQYQKVLSLERLLQDWVAKIDLGVRRRDAASFITSQEYDLKTLRDHLDTKSPIFRHSLRLTLTLVVGYFVGKLFDFQNPYWILLTTLVIMRPGYALTKERYKQRLYGTLIGGAVAVATVLVFQNKLLYGILAVISLILAFSMIQKNYKTAAAFITLNVVFVYSLLRPDALEVIQFRVLDTIVGAGLAYLANKILWPTWEYTTIDNFISRSIKASADYIQEIEKYYNEKKDVQSTYRLARKEAFLAIGDLNAAFQRMTQEPKTEKDQLEGVYNLVSLNQEFLASAASLGTFIRNHQTTAASQHFKTYIRAIQANLRESDEKEISLSEEGKDIADAEAFFEDIYQHALADAPLLTETAGPWEEKQITQLQEIQMVREQLYWLFQISESIRKSVEQRAKT